MVYYIYTIILFYSMSDSTQEKQTRYASKLEQRIVFFFVTMGILTITYGVLFAFDFLPEKPGAQDITTEQATKADSASTVVTDQYPTRIIFDTLDNKQVAILNPTESDVKTLDDALLTGVVRYPNSADFINTGTIFLLGHSSYLPVVNNKNFQAFNGIQKLSWGDTIRLQSNDTEYVYSVDRVYQAKAPDSEVALERGTAKLTLATCNSFGTKDDRYIVEASLVSSHSLVNN